MKPILHTVLVSGIASLLTTLCVLYAPLGSLSIENPLFCFTAASESLQESEISPCNCKNSQVVTDISPCNVSMTPHIVRQSAPESLRVGDEFQITFTRVYSSGSNCSLTILKPRDVFIASVQVSDADNHPDIVTHASVEFVKMVTDASIGLHAAEYVIRGHVYDAGKHTVKLAQMYFLDSDGTDVLSLSKESADSELGNVRFMTGYTPLQYGHIQWGWSGMWYELWELNVKQDSPQEERGSLRTCSTLQDAVTGRWKRLGDTGLYGEGLEWQPYNCQLSSNYSRLQGKNIVMVGASIMLAAFGQLCRLLNAEKGQWCKPSYYKSKGGQEVHTNLGGRVNMTHMRYHSCGPWDGLKELEKPDIVIGTCGSHMWTVPSANHSEGLEEMHGAMRAGAYWGGRNVSWVWMTTNPFNPAMDTASWKLKALAALPRFEEMNRQQREIVGDSIPVVDWYKMAAPMLMYTRDQVHFNFWTYRELARVIAHSLVTNVLA